MAARSHSRAVTSPSSEASEAPAASMVAGTVIWLAVMQSPSVEPNCIRHSPREYPTLSSHATATAGTLTAFLSQHGHLDGCRDAGAGAGPVPPFMLAVPFHRLTLPLSENRVPDLSAGHQRSSSPNIMA